MADIVVRQMPIFKKAYKRLHANEKLTVDEAIRAVIEDPKIGQEKRGDLAGVFVHKFRTCHQEMLLAYEWNKEERVLLALGVHENFYRDLKRNK